MVTEERASYDFKVPESLIPFPFLKLAKVLHFQVISPNPSRLHWQEYIIMITQEEKSVKHSVLHRVCMWKVTHLDCLIQ